MASNNTSAVIINCPAFAGRNKASFQEYKSKLRVCLSLYSKAVFVVFQGKAQPSSTLGRTDTATLSAVVEHKWLQANRDLWCVLLLTTSGSVNNTVKTSEEKRPDDGAGHGQLARKVLAEKYNDGGIALLRGTIVSRTKYCKEKYVNVLFFVCAIGPINYGPP